ncbi:uncharacterized protein LOC120091906 isoform X2 [Benincasa hispida]|uniref:uncharacterized protein LOC120091906 isoform X2 n=1 Tax=Benincasa hispida TaxID=102211 RepID=UPI0019023092|nr:uncharacterized protein LOC120091906 isoform X2 [Benincasa hispida]
MPYLFLILLIFSSTLHACEARCLRFFESSSFVSRIEPHSISQGIWADQPERSFEESNSDKLSYKEIIVGIEMLKGMKKHGSRLVMEFPMKEKVLNSKENEVGEDMVVMDYAQPHRKPPIHNEKP